MNRAVVFAVLLVASVVGIRTVAAHHSFAIYDFDVQTEFHGAVETLNFRNPHIAMTLRVVDDAGAVQIIEFIEGAPANMLARKGLRPDMLEEGTEITVFGSPLIADPSKFFLRRVRLADGSEYE